MLAVGKDVNAVGHRLAPMPMGPGDKPRDDSGMYSLKTKKPVPRFGGRSAAPFRKIPGGASARPALRLGQPPSRPPGGCHKPRGSRTHLGAPLFTATREPPRALSRAGVRRRGEPM